MERFISALLTAYNSRAGSMGYTDQIGPMHYTPSRPQYPEPYGVDNYMGRQKVLVLMFLFPHIIQQKMFTIS